MCAAGTFVAWKNEWELVIALHGGMSCETITNFGHVLLLAPACIHCEMFHKSSEEIFANFGCRRQCIVKHWINRIV